MACLVGVNVAMVVVLISYWMFRSELATPPPWLPWLNILFLSDCSSPSEEEGQSVEECRKHVQVNSLKSAAICAARQTK